MATRKIGQVKKCTQIKFLLNPLVTQILEPRFTKDRRGLPKLEIILFIKLLTEVPTKQNSLLDVLDLCQSKVLYDEQCSYIDHQHLVG